MLSLSLLPLTLTIAVTVTTTTTTTTRSHMDHPRSPLCSNPVLPAYHPAAAPALLLVMLGYDGIKAKRQQDPVRTSTYHIRTHYLIPSRTLYKSFPPPSTPSTALLLFPPPPNPAISRYRPQSPRATLHALTRKSQRRQTHRRPPLLLLPPRPRRNSPLRGAFSVYVDDSFVFSYSLYVDDILPIIRVYSNLVARFIRRRHRKVLPRYTVARSPKPQPPTSAADLRELLQLEYARSDRYLDLLIIETARARRHLEADSLRRRQLSVFRTAIFDTSYEVFGDGRLYEFFTEIERIYFGLDDS
ncbi:hypothetical protein GALMADRAFT_159133 [Galerina marginata CBS 339.88]|uniref:Uncharacterized protein n=1 Tax=Galerina marginata (strain CBS 339.88) TaxID=685588 RepID=A0A067SQ36_GALM3|nr:hypothetical protein GALMADRAFT_159133 [Galerina marginata CBS 339.88]